MADEKQVKAKKPIQLLRDRCGGMSDEMKQYYKEFIKTRKALVAALDEGPATVPELASRSGLASPEVMWHLMAMKKYSTVEEGPLMGDYLTFSLAASKE